MNLDTADKIADIIIKNILSKKLHITWFGGEPLVGKLIISRICKALKEEGFRLVAGGTDNHLLLIDVKASCGITGKKAQRLLDEVNITANKNAIPFDTEKPFKASGIRVGTPAMTTKGFKEEDFREVGKIIALRLKNDETDEIKNECLRRVKALTDKVTMYKDLSYED